MAHDTKCIPRHGQHYAWPDDAQTVRYTLERVRANVAFLYARRHNVKWADALTTFRRQGERIAAGLQSLQVAFAAAGRVRGEYTFTAPAHRVVCQHVCRANAWLERLTLRVSSPLIQQSPRSPFTGNRATRNPKFDESYCEVT